MSSKLFDFVGENEFCPGGSMYTNPKDSSLFLSLGNHVDLYFPSRKRSRISAPFVFTEHRFVQKKQVSIEILPDECLFEIFRRLPGAEERSACACVSNRWLSILSNICRDELCSQEGPTTLKSEHGSVAESSDAIGEDVDGFLSRSLEGKKATDVRLAAIAVGTASRGGLGKLSVRGSPRVTDVGLRAVSRGCPSLKVLSLWNLPAVGDKGLSEIASGCRQIEKLDLCRCSGITDKGLVAIAKSCPNLTDLTIESCPSIGNEGLQAVGHYCSNLKSLAIKDCPLVGDQGISSIVSSATYNLSKVKLDALNVSDISLAVIGHYGKVISELVLVNLANVSERGFWVMGNGHGLQKLKSFTITSCKGVTDIGLEAIGKGCPNLKHFCLRRCAFLSDNGVVAFTKVAVSLESLHLEECHRITHFGVFGSLINCGAKLKALSLVNCYGIQDLNPAFPMLSPCKSLQSLSIHNCPGFGDSSLAFLGKLCPQLQHVELIGLQGVTDVGFIPVLKSCQAGLIKVNVSDCVNLSDQAVSALTELHGWTLEALNLENCRTITDTSLLAVAKNCKSLKDLDVSRCSISDSGIAALALSNLTSLQILSLSGCAMVSDKSMPALAKLGKTLLGLNLQHCNAISRSNIRLLVDQLWRCDILS